MGMTWTESQKKVIDRRERNILVSAAAGSGKTAVLVERIIQKITQDKVDIDKLLIVTFTNAAAAEMRERIRDAIEKKLEEEGYTKVIVKLDDSPEMINGLDGVICTGTFTKKMVEAIEIWECPVIFIDADPNPKRFDSIVVDYRRAVEEIVSYLVGCGHTKIGMIGCREVDKEGDEVLDTRIQHFQNALKKRGLYHPEYTKFGAYYAKYGYKLLKEFYEEGNLPTALFVANDSMAAGSYRAAYELGLKIPDDISIIGFNDIPTAKYMVPPLTTVRLYMEFMGEYAVKLLEERIIHGREICVKVSIPTKLYIRDSVKKF